MAARVASRRRVLLAAPAAILVVASCGSLPFLSSPAQPPVAVNDQAPPPALGPRDLAIGKLDPAGVLAGVPGGGLCRPAVPAGSRGSGTRFTLAAGFTCPRAGDDRTVWFEFADAWEKALNDLGTGGSGGGETGGAADPLVRDWVVRGETRVGTSRVVGVNGPGTLYILVTLDQIAP